MGRERSSYPLVTLESGDFSVPRIRDESQNLRSLRTIRYGAMSIRMIVKKEMTAYANIPKIAKKTGKRESV